jgi:O-succinylbenzoate synthase
MTDSPVYYWEYLLVSGAALNSASVRRTFPGALILKDSGVGCIHPWPEFGDAPLSEQLALLQSGHPTPLALRALACAALDSTARQAGVSLFQNLEIPASHYSWSFGHPTTPQINRLLQENWPALKAKGYPNWGETLRFLEACQRSAQSTDLRFRIDFNSCLDPAAFHKFIEFMPLRVYRSIDFVEDPYPYHPETWSDSQQTWGIPLALDKGWQSASTGFDAVVIKPARRDWRSVAALHPDRNLIFTSAMDHPIGQMYAAYEAAVARQELGDQVGLCGLCTQHLFSPDAFLERVLSPGGHLQPDLAGGGLGFGDLIETLPWRRLTP